VVGFHNYKAHVPALFLVLLLVVSFLIVKPLFLALFVGALLAYIFYPIFLFLARKCGNKAFSSFLTCALVFLLIVIPAGFFAKVLVQQSYSFYLLLKQELSLELFKTCEQYVCTLINNLAENEILTSQINGSLTALTNWILKTGSQFLIRLPGLLLSMFVTFFTMFYFLKEGKDLLAKLDSYFSAHNQKYPSLLPRLNEILKGVLYGYLLIAVAQGALGALGFFLFGISSPLFWGFVMALLSLVPLLGTGLVWVPASLVLVLEGVSQNSTGMLLKGIGLFVYSFVIVGGIDNLLRPKLISGKAKVHTAVVMVGIFGGVAVLGPAGVIIGPLVLAMTTELLNLYLTSES